MHVQLCKYVPLTFINYLYMFILFISQMYKTKAANIASKLLPAFNTPTGIPHAMVNLRTYETFVNTHFIFK